MATWEEDRDYILTSLKKGTAGDRTDAFNEWKARYEASGTPTDQAGMMSKAEYGNFLDTGEVTQLEGDAGLTLAQGGSEGQAISDQYTNQLDILNDFKNYVTEINSRVEQAGQESAASGLYDRNTQIQDNASYTSRQGALDIQKYMDENGLTAQDLKQDGLFMDLGVGNTLLPNYEASTASTGVDYRGDVVDSRLDQIGDYTVSKNIDKNYDLEALNLIAGAALGGGYLTGLGGALGGEAAAGAGAFGDIIYNLGNIDNTDPNAPAPEIAYQEEDVSDILGNIQVAIPDFSLPEKDGGGGGSSSSPSDSASTSPAPSAPEDSASVPVEDDARYRYENGRWVDIVSGEIISGPANDSGTMSEEEMGKAWESGDYSWGEVDWDTQEPSEDTDLGLGLGDIIWNGTGGFGDSTSGTGTSGNQTSGTGESSTGSGGSGASDSGLTLGGIDYSGTGTGSNGSGSGTDGTGEGSGGDGFDLGSGGGGGAGGISDAEWGELFPYTKLTPAQKAKLAPHIDYIKKVRGKA